MLTLLNSLDLKEIVTIAMALWGAILSTFLGAIKIWETFSKNRLQLDAAYDFSGHGGPDSEITIVNLSPIPVQVAGWSLEWRPRFFYFWVKTIKIEFEEKGGRFEIESRGHIALTFEDRDKFDWSYRVVTYRHLYIILHIFGRRKSKALKIGAGQ